MERLTKRMLKGTGYYMKCSESCPYDCQENCDCEEFDKFVDRLAAIENILGDDYGMERLQELVEADRECMIGIPPVRLHQRIFRVFNGEIKEETVCKAAWEPFTPRPRWKIWVMGSGLPYYWDDCIGNTVFCTREYAEAALKRGQKDGM